MATIDIDKPGKYPIVLSDALLGKASQESFTGIRYNHKPDPSSESSSSSLQLKPSGGDSSYDLSLTDSADEYVYQGVRTSGDGQFILIFDPIKKHFVLHKVDSTFDMNLVKSPWEQNASALRSQYPQLDTTVKPQADTSLRKPVKAARAAPAPKPEPKRRKPAPPKKKPPPVRAPTPEEEESDDGLTVEYPDAQPSKPYHYQSTPTFQRQESEEISDEDADAEGEDDPEETNRDVDYLKLPSPGNNNAGGMSDEDIELDLEQELEQALMAEGGADESSESEEE